MNKNNSNNQPNVKRLGQTVEALSHKRRWSTKQLAAAARLDTPTVNAIEDGSAPFDRTNRR